MFRFRFNEVFAGLLVLSCVSAFILPARLTNPLRSIQGLFAPVSRPARAIGASLHARFAPRERDNRSVTDVKDENERLRAVVLSLSGQLEELKRINEDRDRLGEVRPLCTPFAVVGSDPGPRESLILNASTRDGVAVNMPVLYSTGVVGVVERVGPSGAQVKLITDKDFQAKGRFHRFVQNQPQPIETTPPMVRGTGKGTLVIVNVPLKDTSLSEDLDHVKVKVGDVVALDDPDWPRNLEGQMIGQVESIQPQRDAPLYAEIRLRPTLNLAALREVMVMNKLNG